MKDVVSIAPLADAHRNLSPALSLLLPKVHCFSMEAAVASSVEYRQYMDECLRAAVEELAEALGRESEPKEP
jgi:hypothetical protein